MSTDTILWLAYIACAAACVAFNRPNAKAAAGALAGASTVFFVASMMYEYGVSAEFFHLVICAVCWGWAAAMIRYFDAIFIAISISVMGILQLVFSVDSYLYPNQVTALLSSYTAMAIAVHVIIMLATLSNGINLRNGIERRNSGRGTAL